MPAERNPRRDEDTEHAQRGRPATQQTGDAAQAQDQAATPAEAEAAEQASIEGKPARVDADKDKDADADDDEDEDARPSASGGRTTSRVIAVPVKDGEPDLFGLAGSVEIEPTDTNYGNVAKFKVKGPKSVVDDLEQRAHDALTVNRRGERLAEPTRERGG